MKVFVQITLAFLVVFLSANCDQKNPCNSNDPNVRQNFPVTTPQYWPTGHTRTVVTPPNPRTGAGPQVEIVTYLLHERLPELSTVSSPGDRPVRFGCTSNLAPTEHSLLIEYSGPCDNFKIYSETFGTGSESQRDPGYFSPDNFGCVGQDQVLSRFSAFNEEQMILCGRPVIKQSNSGGSEYRYHATVYVTSRTFTTESGSERYRIKMVASDQFPFVRSVRDLAGIGCGYNPNLEMLTIWRTAVDII